MRYRTRFDQLSPEELETIMEGEPWAGVDNAAGLYRYRLMFLVQNREGLQEIAYEEARLEDNPDKLVDWRGDMRLRVPLTELLELERRFGKERMKRYSERAVLAGDMSEDFEDDDFLSCESDGDDPEVHAAVMGVIRETFRSLQDIIAEPTHSSGWSRLN